ncbi:CAP Gly-rich domain-containing protein, partial [Radiomyces spectabilis]|uniref:CAP Gly-rich domain-containing protein n=1 Tax=Radiomyces spectabilis TaxID=64574 RepID=UPI00221E8457
MSKIARPSYGTGIASLKKSRFSASSSSPSNNADAVTPNIPTPGVQRRSLKSSKSLTSAAPTRRTRSAVARSSLSSTDDVSESEATSRFSGASRTSTPRSSLSRSPTEKQSSSSGGLTVGTRVAVPSLSVVGTLRFVGETKFKPGLWTGIELDFATGKNDGSVQGVRYFTCPANTGLFVLASKITPLT